MAHHVLQERPARWARLSRRLPAAAVLVLAWCAGAQAADWFVSPLGDDGTAGDQATPWRTIGRAVAAAQPGDTITVAAGEYREAIVIGNSGLPGEPITLQAAPEARVVLNCPQPGGNLSGLDFRTVSHWVVEGFTLTGGYVNGAWIRFGAHHITLRRCRSERNDRGVYGTESTDITLEDCEVADCQHGFESDACRRVSLTRCLAHGVKFVTGDNDPDGFSVERQCSDVTLQECEAHHNEQAGFDIKAPGTVIRKCRAYENYHGFKAPYGWALVEDSISLRNGDLGLMTEGGTSGPIRILRCTIAGNRQQGAKLTALPGRVNPPDPLIGWCVGRLPWPWENRPPAATYDVLIRDCIIAFNASTALDFDAGVRLVCDHTVLYHEDEGFQIIVRRGNPEVRLSGKDVTAGALRSDVLPQFGPGISVKRPAL